MGRMAGAVVENLSNRKLFWILTCLVAAQIAFFLLGGVVAPMPSSTMEFDMSKCRDRSLGYKSGWFYIRPFSAPNCERIPEEGLSELGISNAREIVWVAQMPHVRGNVQLEYSPWFQTILGLLVVDPEYSPHGHFHTAKNPEVRLEIRLGYQNHGDKETEWRELSSTVVTRRLSCEEPEKKMEGHRYVCEPIELFELGSSDYPFYLLNVRLPDCNATGRYNCDIGKVTHLSLVEIHQNGGFTKVWLGMKTLLTPLVLLMVVWYWRRISLLPRKPFLLEKALLSLGVAMVALDFPFEWMSLWFRMPYLLLLTDIRQGIFYLMLFCFWLIFTGEHLMDDTGKNSLSFYWKHLSVMVFAFVCLFVFDICERGVHLKDPFHSIWSTTFGQNVAYAFVVLAGFSAGLYFFYLFYLIARVIRTIKRKRANLLQMNENRRLKAQGIIYRFKFLMLATLVVSALTVAGFIMEQVGEGQLRWGDYEESPMLNYSSAFLTGTYGMWNIYVLLLLAMYAPSHKQYHEAEQIPTLDLGEEDDMMMEERPGCSQEGSGTEAAALTALIKPATD